MSAFLVVILALGAGFQEVDKAQEKADLLQKLTSDINKVDHSIEVTKALIKKSPDAPYLADLYFRLAELYVERSRYVYARTMENLPEGERTLAGEQALEVQIGKRLAIETYTKILEELPEYQHVDQVRFFRAHEYRELGEWDTMMAEYKDLIARHPKSDWAIEARLILADYHFDKGEIPQAEDFYTQILDLPENHLSDMSRYKLGWIRINQERFAEALRLFEMAVSSNKKRKKGAIGDAKRLDVKREALMAIAWPFSEVKKPHQAPEYFRELADSKTLYVDAMKRLANRYFVRTDYTASALLYREIVELSSDVDSNIDFVQRIYDSVRNMAAKDPRRYANAAGDVTAIVENLARFENHWRFADEEKAQLKKDFELRARDLATRLHVEAKQKKDEEAARIAAQAYRHYLSLFTESEERKNMQLNRAEALFLARDKVAAGEQYEEVARTKEDGPERRDLLYSSVVSFHEALLADGEYRRKHPTRGGLLDMYSLLRAREGLKQIGAYYVKTWPESPKAANVKFNVARMYYQQGEYERAAELFQKFVAEHPVHEDTDEAGNLALDALHRLDKYDELVKVAKGFVDNPAIKDTKFKNEVAQIGEAAKRRKVEMTLIAGGEGDFSERMVAEWEKHKDDTQGEEFLYAAFVKFKSEGNVLGVLDFGGRLLGAYPQSERLPEVLSTMANFALRAADFERGAVLFEELFKRYPKDKQGVSVLASAATTRLLLGDIEKAAEDFRALRASGDAKQKQNAHERLMEIYREAQIWEELGRVAQTAAQEQPAWVSATAHLGIAYAEQGKDELAERELKRALERKAAAEPEREAQARALFALARLYQRRFDQLVFTDAGSAEAILGQKVQLLSAIEQLLVQTVGTGQGVLAIAALQESARLYQRFGAFIEKAPLPDGISAADRKVYEQELSKQAQTYYQKAADALKVCVDKSEQLRVFSPHGLACNQGSSEPVVLEARRRRAAGAVGDEAYQREIQDLRVQLAKTPENTELLKRLARRAMQVGDFHLAKLALGKVLEAGDDSEAQNLLGVTLWSLGEPQSAYAALDKAFKQRSTQAAANLAALCEAYGFSRLKDRYYGEAGVLPPDLSAPDYHPRVRQMVAGAAGGGS